MPSVLITTASSDGTERTWRTPLATRIILAVLMGVFVALPALWLALTLWANQVANPGWIAFALAIGVWGLLAWRALIQSVTLTPDTLVIRNIPGTHRVPLADLTATGFRRGRLTVTCAHGAAAAERRTVGVGRLGTSHWTGLPGDADAIAQVIIDAAGLPPLPPRREIISRKYAQIMLLAAVLLFGAGVYCGPLQGGTHGLPVALREVGVVLYVGGAGLLGLAVRITFDHRRHRRRPTVR